MEKEKTFVPMMTSLDIAHEVGKLHKNVLADIRDEIKKIGDEEGRLIFQLISYVDSQNRSQRAYALNNEGVAQRCRTS